MSSITYTHRNGETEPPTEPGRYWFDGYRVSVAGNQLHVRDMLDVDTDGCIDPYGTWIMVVSWDGQWWGPVMPPWENK